MLLNLLLLLLLLLILLVLNLLLLLLILLVLNLLLELELLLLNKVVLGLDYRSDYIFYYFFILVLHGLSLDFIFYFYSILYFCLFYTLDLIFLTYFVCLGGINCVFINLFLDLIYPFYVLDGVLILSVIWLWLSDD